MPDFSRIAYQMFPTALNLHMKELYVTLSENLDEHWTQVLWNKTWEHKILFSAESPFYCFVNSFTATGYHWHYVTFSNMLKESMM
jgi:hypothetical protein